MVRVHLLSGIRGPGPVGEGWHLHRRGGRFARWVVVCADAQARLF